MTFIDFIRNMTRSPAFKFILVILIIIALTIPLLLVVYLNYERQQYARQAQAEVGNMWGKAQTLRGPFLIVPTIKTVEVQSKDGVRTNIIKRNAIFLPETLDVKSSIETEIRQRGIFSIPLYRSVMTFSGSFVSPDLKRINRDVDEIIWEEAVLAVFINDVTAIKKTAKFQLNGATEMLFRAGVGGNNEANGIHVPIVSNLAQGNFRFQFTLHLNGSSNLNFVPAGGETTNAMTSDWPHPKFIGTFLPETRSVSDQGFSASWSIPRLARGQSQAFLANNLSGLMRNKSFGVSFHQPIGFYSLIERSLKYAIGFIAIAFFAVFIMEFQSGHRVHWIQYIFVGMALLIFYLVLLGISEHAGFEVAYLSAAIATSTLIASYVGSALKSVKQGLSMFGIIALIYGLLYLLLRVEDYAMLIGSISAFTLLAFMMFSTRNIDWSGKK